MEVIDYLYPEEISRVHRFLLTLQSMGIEMAKKNRQQTPRNTIGRQGDERRTLGNSSKMETKMDSTRANWGRK